jgi:predicted GNAT family acetyltransferase
MPRAYPGSTGAYNYGPICVAENHRGRGLAVAMFEELRAQLPGREGCTFIRADNAISRKVHVKMGMQEVAEFNVNGHVCVGSTKRK